VVGEKSPPPTFDIRRRKMKKDKVVLDRETYERLLTLRDSHSNYYMENYEKYRDKFIEQVNENKKLQKENGYLKALFDKEGDTQAIKYNDKLYRIVNISHYKDGTEETLDICLVPVSEVG
jgi:DNA-binding helix-hairpin-helix protein with protein kinase domain